MRFFVLAVLAALSLAGCGKRGAPSPPGPASAVTYPHVYPAE
jgi:predicted small lipoprotein YifL